MMSILLLHVYICLLPILLKKTDFHYCSCIYHLQLHWSCWRAVPGHLGKWMHVTWSVHLNCLNLKALQRKNRKKRSGFGEIKLFSLPHLHIVVIEHWCPARGYTLYYDEFWLSPIKEIIVHHISPILFKNPWFRSIQNPGPTGSQSSLKKNMALVVMLPI